MQRFTGAPEYSQYARAEEPTPWARELGGLARGNFRHMAEVLRDAGGHENVRKIWDEIDRSVPVAGLDPSARVFAGISGDGKRYIEVYRGLGHPDVLGVFAATPELIENGLRLDGAAPATPTRAGGDFFMRWADPQRTDANTPAAMHLRPALMGTSSYFGQEGNNASYAGEYFPMAHMQNIADFDTDNLRTAEMDDGRPLPHDLIVCQPFSPEEGGMPQTVPVAE
jgi:hypothetical protein